MSMYKFECQAVTTAKRVAMTGQPAMVSVFMMLHHLTQYMLFTGKGVLSFACWLLAWDAYTLAAAALGQLSHAAAISHKLVIAQLAAQAPAKGRDDRVAVIYDRLARYSGVQQVSPSLCLACV